MKRIPMAAMLSCSGYRLTDFEKQLFSRCNPLGINLFSRNIKDPAQLKALITEIKTVIGRDDVLIGVDQEGGRVRRLAEPNWPGYHSAIDLGKLPLKEAVRAAELQALLISADLIEAGINWNYAPVLDLLHPQTSPVLKSRCFGSSKLVVEQLGKAIVDAYIKQGTCPCIKHMPGHGRAAVDPHLALPKLDCRLDELADDFYPFQKLNYAPAGMTAHIIISEIDSARPITQSPEGIKQLIRGIIGFEGLLISDAIDMHALRGSLTEKALSALNAGCDCVCYAMGTEAGLSELAAVCPQLSDTALARFEKVKNITNRPASLTNKSALRTEYECLTGAIEPYNDTYDATEILNKLQQGENQC